MRRGWLTFFALLSLGLGFVASLGYIGWFEVYRATPRSLISLSTRDGVISFVDADYLSSNLTRDPNQHFIAYAPLSRPKLYDAIFGFGLRLRGNPNAISSVFAVRVPIWCILVACSIAPLRWWLGRWRAKGTPRGFPLEPARAALL